MRAASDVATWKINFVLTIIENIENVIVCALLETLALEGSPKCFKKVWSLDAAQLFIECLRLQSICLYICDVINQLLTH